MADWYENESFWETLYPFLFPTERLAASSQEMSQLLELLDFEGRDVLDLCCGPGRHSVDLARRGFSVTGVDLSPFLLGKARELADAEQVAVEWVQADMREFSRLEAFDLVVNMFTSIGYFDDADDDLGVLRNIHSSLRDGGRLVIDTFGKECLASVFQPVTADERPGEGLLVRRHQIIDDWSRIRNEWIVIDKGRVASFEFHHTIFSAQELKDRLGAAGFRSLRAYGDLEGNAYGPGAERLVVIAVK